MSVLSFLFGNKNKSEHLGDYAIKNTFDWRVSKPHILLLSRFITAQTLRIELYSNWESVLSEPVQKTFDYFMAEGILVSSDLFTKLNIMYNKSDLKLMLKQRNLPVSGDIGDLIKRLIAFDPNGMSSMMEDVSIFECSDEARELSEKFIKDNKAQYDEAISNSMSFLYAKDFANAVLTVAKYEANQVFPRGVNINWSKPDISEDVWLLETIFSSEPKILIGLPDADWFPLKIAASMNYLWGKNNANKWLKNNFLGIDKFDPDTSARMILFHATHKRDIENFIKAGVSSVNIVCCNDSCKSCKMRAKKNYFLSDIPEIPHIDCTHKYGCRCYIVKA